MITRPHVGSIARAGLVALLALLLSACGGGDGDTTSDGSAPSRVFVADSINSVLVSFVNQNPSPGPMRIDRTVSGPSVSSTMPDLAYDSRADRLYIVNNSSIMVLNNASTRNGTAAPDRTITSSSISSTIAAIALDTTNDILYATTTASTTVLAFSNISTANGSIGPARTLSISRAAAAIPVVDIYVDTNRDILFVSGVVTGGGGVNRVIMAYDRARNLPTGVVTADRELTFLDSIRDIVGDPSGDRIFVADETFNSVLVFDDASTADAVAPDRTISLPDLPRRLALAPVSNRLYSIAANMQGIYIINNASIASGSPTANLITSTSAGSFTAIAVAP